MSYVVDASPAAAPLQPLRAWRSPKSWLLLVTVLTLGLAIDLATKAWTFEGIELDRERFLDDEHYNPIHSPESNAILPWNLLDMRLVINRGAVFGLGQDKREFFIAFTVVAVAAALVFFARSSARYWLGHVGLGLILAGGVGNLFDRWQYAVVRDFLHILPGWRLPFGLAWPGGSTDVFPWVFNLADVMLLTGMGLLLVHINRIESKKERKKQETIESLKEAAAEDHRIAESSPAAISHMRADQAVSQADSPVNDRAASIESRSF